MPDVPIEFRWRDFTTDQQVTVRSFRPFVNVQIGNMRPLCFFDTGAPFSVISHSVARHIPWTSSGTSFVSPGRSTPIDWQGIPCDFGETTLFLLDNSGAAVTGPLPVVGKFARARHPSLENYILLGMNFLHDNTIDLSISVSGGAMVGNLSVP